jgi:16S rRNA (uracil1498-N3)-methyltransferase
MPMRFLIETAIQPGLRPGIELVMDRERSHYLCKVMRMKSGDTVMCFDGKGCAFTAVLAAANPKKSTLQVTTIEPVRPARPGMHMALSMLKGQAMDRALQLATELGATGLSLIRAKRSNVHLDEHRQDHKMAHWRNVIAGACEQSGHLYLPVLDQPIALDVWLAGRAAETVIVFDLNGEPLPASLPVGDYSLLIGPEGGWDDSERDLFSRLALATYNLGAQTLRAETTPAVAITLIAHLQGS